jgi:DNA-binding NtrC family response regulator
MVMPGGISGRALADRLQLQQPKLKVIFTSGYSVDLLAKNFALREGFNFLAKPFHPMKLAKAVRDCLDGKTLPLEIRAPDSSSNPAA